MAQVRSLRTEYSLSEFIPGFPRNGPGRAGPALGPTRARGKDDGSLHKLPQNREIYNNSLKFQKSDFDSIWQLGRPQ